MYVELMLWRRVGRETVVERGLEWMMVVLSKIRALEALGELALSGSQNGGPPLYHRDRRAMAARFNLLDFFLGRNDHQNASA